jgi:phosphate transport system substrate-binding protein
MKKICLIAALSAAALVALSTGCRKGEETDTIQVKGSDTLLMLSQRWAEAFMAQNPEAVVQVTGGGSGVGIKALVEGTTDRGAYRRPAGRRLPR